jgi:hypothetical protein
MIGIKEAHVIAKEIYEEIVHFLEEPTPDEVESIISRGNQLQSYMGRLSVMLADAKYYQDNALVYHAENAKGMVSSTAMNSYVKALCKDENRLVNIIEKLLVKCQAENDWNRTLVSKAKVEYEANRNNNGNY